MITVARSNVKNMNTQYVFVPSGMRISSFRVLRGINSLRTWSVRFGSLLLYWLNDKAGSGGSSLSLMRQPDITSNP
jgi:hypothetical protein